jgi:hypothetical protein
MIPWVLLFLLALMVNVREGYLVLVLFDTILGAILWGFVLLPLLAMMTYRGTSDKTRNSLGVLVLIVCVAGGYFTAITPGMGFLTP